MDHGEDLDWLRDRPQVQRVLAQVLRRPWADVQVGLGEPLLSPDGRLLRLRDLRYARELDLSREELPPGLPIALTHPAEWHPTWWQAPSGSGRSWMGAWLSARGLARHVILHRQEDLKHVPPRGALFLELLPGVTLSLEDCLALRFAHRPLCVASAAPAPSWSPKGSAVSFLTLHSPRVEDYLPELVDWVSSLLGEEGHFDPDRAELWMRRVALPLGAARHWGDCLGLLGLLDEISPRSLSGKSLDEVTELYLKRRLLEAIEATDYHPELATNAFSQLVEAATRCLVTQEKPLQSPRSLDEWTALLRPELAEDAPDPSWFASALGKELSRRELRRITQKLPPTAYQITRALERARLLHPVPVSPSALARRENEEAPADLKLGPHFLVRVLDARSTREALRFSPLEWGHAILAGREADRLTRALYEALLLGQTRAVELLLEHFDEESEALIAALESAWIAWGLARLSGVQLSRDLEQDLTLEICRALAPFPDRLEPRFVFDSAENELYCRDAWQSTCLILLDSSTHLGRALLPESRPTERFVHAHRAARRYANQAPESLSLPLWRLLDHASFRLPRGEESPVLSSADLLLAPAHLTFDSQTSNGASELEDALEDARSIQALLAVTEGRGHKPSFFYERLWGVLARSPHPLARAPEKIHTDLWRALGAPELEVRRQHDLPVAWALLLPHQFAAWLPLTRAPLPLEAAQRAPLDPLLRLWSQQGGAAFSPEALRALYQRAPHFFAKSLPELVARAPEPEVEELLLFALESRDPLFLDALPSVPELLTLPAKRLDRARSFLVSWAQLRAPSFSMAHDRLTQIDAHLRKSAHRGPGSSSSPPVS